MTAPSPAVELGGPPSQPICRSAKDETRPCRFAGVCHESRQRIAHYEGLRGRACWAFQQQVARLRRVRQHGIRNGAGLVCMNCGADYTSEYWLESDAATFGRGLYPDPRICHACWRPAREGT